jgi:hypothetical protein
VVDGLVVLFVHVLPLARIFLCVFEAHEVLWVVYVQ